MNKTFKKSNITNYINIKNLRENISEEEISEFVDGNGSLISKDNNYVANTNYIKSKKTTDDYVRNATQGPEAYFIYGGPYYGINYNYVVSEEEDVLSEEEDMYDELNVVPDIDTMDSGRKLADKDIRKHYHKRGFPDQDYKDSSEWSRHSLPYDTKFNFLDEDNGTQIDEMKDIVDEIVRNKRDIKGMVKKTNEQDMLTDKVKIPDIMELKDVHEKPMIIRKVNNLMDLINKEDLHGVELSIVINHILDNIDIMSIDEEHRELLGDKIKYVGEEK
jgi:hypothetical protein